LKSGHEGRLGPPRRRRIAIALLLLTITLVLSFGCAEDDWDMVTRGGTAPASTRQGEGQVEKRPHDTSLDGTEPILTHAAAERVERRGGFFLQPRVAGLKEGDELQDGAGLDGPEPILAHAALGCRTCRVVSSRLSSSGAMEHVIHCSLHLLEEGGKRWWVPCFYGSRIRGPLETAL
jgi:hypothetical protein